MSRSGEAPLAGPRPGTRLVGAAALISGVTVTSRVLGFVRALVLSSAVGVNALGSAYTSANVVPNVLFEVAAGGALAGAVVPLLAGPLAARMRRDVDRVTSALLGWTMAVLVPLALAMAALARPIAAGLLGPAAGDAALDVAAAFLRVFAVQVPLYGVAVVLFGVLQAHHRFAWPALAPLVNNVVVIGVLVAFDRAAGGVTDLAAVPSGALALLGWGTTAGVAAMAACVAVPAWRTGLRVRPTLRFADGEGRRARTLLLSGLGAVAAQQLSVLAAVVVANRWGGDGTYLIVQFLQQVYLLPYAVLAYPLVTAAFPRLADRVARDDHAGFAALVSTTTRALVVVSAASAAVLVAAATGVERFYAGIADGDVAGSAAGLAWMAPGLVGYVVAFHLSRALYALHRGRSAGLALGAGWLTMAVASVLAAAILVPAGTSTPGALRAVGVATTVGMTTGAALAVAAVHRAAGAQALVGLARTAGVSIAAGGAGAWVGRLVADAVLDAAGAGVLAGVVSAAAGALLAVLAVGGSVLLADRGSLGVLRSART